MFASSSDAPILKRNPGKRMRSGERPNSLICREQALRPFSSAGIELNLDTYSLFGNSEMNAAFWDHETARVLLSELLSEHLDRDIAGLDDRAALQLFGRIARNNRRLLENGESKWQGLAFSLF